jgi:methylenetetrahydrofolate reductase (NADPH)
LSVNNDFHQPKTIFDALQGLEVPDLDKVPVPEPQTNGVDHSTTNGVDHSTTNGVHPSNGVEASTTPQ